MKNLRKNQGITLIALVITIIVMLILVAVTITMAANGGLFEYARKAAGETEVKKEAEKDYTTLGKNMSTNDLIEKYTTNGMKFTAYTVGQTVTVGGQTFYVIEESDETKSTVKLLAANCVDTRDKINGVENEYHNKQTTTTYPVAFDSKEPYSNVYANSTIMDLVDHYVGSLDVTVIEGRLMLKNEAEALEKEHADILYAKEYWLGSPDEFVPDHAYFVDGAECFLGSDDGHFGSVYDGSYFGLRPVIVISKASIE